MINEQLWQELPDDIKEAMEIAGQEMMESGSIGHDEEQSEIEQEFMDAGVVIHEVTEEEKAKWQEIYEAFAKHYFETQDEEFLSVYEMFQEEVEKVRAEQ